MDDDEPRRLRHVDHLDRSAWAGEAVDAVTAGRSGTRGVDRTTHRMSPDRSFLLKGRGGQDTPI